MALNSILPSSHSKTSDYDPVSTSEKQSSYHDSCSDDERRSEEGLIFDGKLTKEPSPEIVLRLKRSLLIYASVALLILVVVVSIVSGLNAREQSGASGGRFPTYPMPDFPMEPVRFMPQSAYAMGSMPESDALWDALIPRHSGVFAIENPEQYGLGRGALIEGSNTSQAYTLTWTHLMHCTRMVRMEFWDLIKGQSDLVGSDPRGDNLPWESQFVIRHINHCFDYFRQYIMCNSDMTIEAEAPRMRESDPHHINGMGTWHMCKKREPVINFLDERVPDDKKFLLPEFVRPGTDLKEYVEAGGH